MTETGLTLWSPTSRMHLVVDTLAGSASISVHVRGIANIVGCATLGIVTLDPDQVLELAHVLTQASIPAPPVVPQRVKVSRSEINRSWVVQCPRCFTVPGAWVDQQAALTAALAHVEAEHASERSAA